MSGFSVGEAGSAGLRLIIQRPLAVLAWGLAFLALYGLPIAVFFALVFKDIPLWIASVRPGATLDPQAVQVMAEFEMINPLILICGLVARSVVYSAVCRAVLEPQDGRFAYLRLGKREAWIGLVSAVFLFGLWLAMVLGMGVAAIPVVIVGAIVHSTAGWIVSITAGVVALCAGLIWLGLRFSLSVPIAFADASFSLGESWTLTKGRTWPLFLTGLLAVLFAWLVEIAVLIVCLIAGLLLLSGVQGGLPTVCGLFVSDPAKLMAMVWPGLACGALLGCMLTGALAAITVAPFATVLKRLRAQAATTPV